MSSMISIGMLLLASASATLTQSWVLQEPPLDTVASVAEWPVPSAIDGQIDIRVTEWRPTGIIPSAVLRLVMQRGQIASSSAVWWGPYLSPQQAPTGPQVQCVTPPGKQRVCVLPLARSLDRDWELLASSLLAVGPYRPRSTKWPEPPPPPSLPDTPVLFVQVIENGEVRLLRGIDNLETHRIVVSVLREIERQAWTRQ